MTTGDCRCCSRKIRLAGAGLCGRCYTYFNKNGIEISMSNLELYGRVYRISDANAFRPLTKEEICFLHVCITSKVIKKFPNGFWDKPNSRNSAKLLLGYVYKDLHSISKDRVVDMSHKEFLISVSLGSLGAAGYFSYIELLSEVYSIPIYKFKQCTKNYWDSRSNCVKALRDYLKESGANTMDAVLEALLYGRVRTFGNLGTLNDKYPNLQSKLDILGIPYSLTDIRRFEKDFFRDKSNVRLVYCKERDKLGLTDGFVKANWSAVLLDSMLRGVRNFYNTNEVYDILFKPT